MADTISVNIKKSIYKKLEAGAEESGFNSIDEYLEFVLNEILSDDEKEETKQPKQDEEKVKARLKALGYM